MGKENSKKEEKPKKNNLKAFLKKKSTAISCRNYINYNKSTWSINRKRS